MASDAIYFLNRQIRAAQADLDECDRMLGLAEYRKVGPLVDRRSRIVARLDALLVKHPAYQKATP